MKQPSYTVVTGASGGIGLELATIAASRGHHLILIARNIQLLEDLRKVLEEKYAVRVIVFPCDLSAPKAVDEIDTFLQQNEICPDILINNAGFGLFGFFKDTDLQRETDLLQVNIVALTQLSKIIFRQMVSRGKGRILNVASVAGFMPGPLMSVYYASKAYVISFSEALANEAQGTGVSVTALCPGPTATNFVENASLQTSMLFKSFGNLPTAKEVALYGYQSMEKSKKIAIYGINNRLMVTSLRFLPRKWVTSMVRYIQRETNPK